MNGSPNCLRNMGWSSARLLAFVSNLAHEACFCSPTKAVCDFTRPTFRPEPRESYVVEDLGLAPDVLAIRSLEARTASVTVVPALTLPLEAQRP
jgi:hypothetical protein